MKKYIIIFLSLLAFNVNAQRKIPAGGTAGQFLKILPNGLSLGWGAASGGSTDTTSLSNRINLRVKYTDTSSMLSKYLRSADTLHMTYTSPLIRQGNNLSAPSVLTSLTAGNGIITSGSTIYVDTLKVASRRTPTFLTDITTPMIIGGTSTTSSLTYKTTTGVGTAGDHIFQVGNNGATEAMRILNNGNVNVKNSLQVGTTGTYIGGGGTTRYTAFSGVNTNGIYLSALSPGSDAFIQYIGGSAVSNIYQYWNSQGNIHTRGKLKLGAADGAACIVAPVSELDIPKITASPNYATISLSNTSTAFSGSASGYFVGAPAGQYIAVNSVGSVAYNFLQFSKNGSSRFKVDSLGYVKGGNLYSNSYTPTLTGVTNVSSSQAYTCQYSRVDSVVTVSGTIGITATANNARTTIGISLPVASNFTAISNAGGAAYTTGNTTAGHGAGIYADTTNDRVELDYYETHGTADIFTFSFTYRIK